MTIRLDNRLQLRHERILASAGSGKTFQLTSRYLQLVAAGAAPGTIFASTFTRLAAGEIRNRIFTRLVDAREDADERRSLADALGVADLDARDVEATLAELARRAHELRIGTLDGFFAAIAGAFPAESGAPPDATIIDEEMSVNLQREALTAALDRGDPDEFVELLRRLTQSAGRSILYTLLGEVEKGHVLWRDTVSARAWDMPVPPGRLEPADLARAIEHLSRTPPTPKGQVSAWTKDTEAALRHDWQAFFTNGMPPKIAAGATEFSRKPIEPRVLDAYLPVIRHVQATELAALREQTIAAYELLTIYDDALRRLKRERGVMTFDDLPYFVRSAFAETSASAVGYRIDGQLHHLLLDEFQDTSRAQWQALRPIAEEIASQDPGDRSLLCVGDVKQSIYVWRNAAPDILDTLPARLTGDAHGMNTRALTSSWRSSPVVIGAINEIFDGIGDSEQLEKYETAREDWGRWFQPHSTEKTTLPGFVELRAVDATGRRRKDAMADAAVACIADLRARNMHLTIGCLTRSNDLVAAIVHDLRAQGIDASGRGGGALTDSAAVNVVLDALQLADHPDDSAAAFHLDHTPLGPVLGDGASLRDDASARRAAARDVRRRLTADGYGDTVAWLAGQLAATCDDAALARLDQLIDLAGRYDDLATLRPAEFISIVERVKIAPIARSRTEVMTIHQAKGLEFDIVVLPELPTLGRGRDSKFVAERGPDDEVTRVCRRPRKELQYAREAEGGLADLITARANEAAREQICMMYVALTRARQGLYILAPSNAAKNDTVRIVRDALAPNAGKDTLGVLAQRGDDAWIDDPPDTDEAPPPNPVDAEPRPAALVFDRAGDARPGRARPPATMGDIGRRAVEALAGQDRDAIDRGLATHAVLEQVEWIETFEAKRQPLRAAVRRATPRRPDAWIDARIDETLVWLEQPTLRQLLSHGGDPARRRVRREQSFARLDDGRVVRGVIDRIDATLDEDGRVVSVRVVDFKTGLPADAADRASSLEKYAGQVQSYLRPAARLLGVAPECVTGVIAAVDTGAVIEI